MTWETPPVLNRDCLIGLVAQYGPAWHNDPVLRGRLGLPDNHFDGPVPMDRIERLLSFNLISGSLISEGNILTPDGVTTFRVEDPTRQCILRDDTMTVLGTFKRGYRIHHYREVLLDATSRLVGDPMAEDLGMAVKSVGLLRGGAVAWSQVVAPASVYAGGVHASPFVLASTSCDGSRATRFTTGAQLVVCDNTLDIALMPGHRTGSVRIKHSEDSLGRLDDVGQALGIMTAETRTVAGLIDMLAGTPVNGKEEEKFLSLTFGEKPEAKDGKRGSLGLTRWENRVGEFMAIMTSPAVKPFAGTAFGLFQADSTFRHHKKASATLTMSGDPIERNFRDAVENRTAKADGVALSRINQVLKSSRRKQLQLQSV